MTGETVYHLPRTQTGTDAHGNPTYGYTTETAIGGAAVSPRRGEEQGGLPGRETVIVGLTLYLPAGTELAATDRMRVRGDVYLVVGEPGVWANPHTGVERGVQVALERVEG